MKRITYARASALLRYDPETGHIYWRQSRGGVREGEIAGTFSTNRNGLTYRLIEIDGRKYGYGPIAWLLITGKYPKGVIDFKNSKTTDTRWDNLISSSHTTKRIFATNRRADNTSGIPGVDFSYGKWRVRVGDTVVGHFDTKTEAKRARQAALPSR